MSFNDIAFTLHLYSDLSLITTCQFCLRAVYYICIVAHALLRPRKKTKHWFVLQRAHNGPSAGCTGAR